jgi:hypothetical protein
MTRKNSKIQSSMTKHSCEENSKIKNLPVLKIKIPALTFDFEC